MGAVKDKLGKYANGGETKKTSPLREKFAAYDTGSEPSKGGLFPNFRAIPSDPNAYQNSEADGFSGGLRRFLFGETDQGKPRGLDRYITEEIITEAELTDLLGSALIKRPVNTLAGVADLFNSGVAKGLEVFGVERDKNPIKLQKMAAQALEELIPSNGTGFDNPIIGDLLQFFRTGKPTAALTVAFEKLPLVAKLGPLMQKVVTGSTASATVAGGVTAAQKGEVDGDVAKTAATAAVFSALFTTIGSFFGGGSGLADDIGAEAKKAFSQKALEDAQKAGVTPKQINDLATLDPSQRQKALNEAFAAAKKQSTGSFSVQDGKTVLNKGATGQIGDDLVAVKNQLEKLRRAEGQKIGAISKELFEEGVTDVASLKTDFLKELGKLNISVSNKKGVLDFGNSRFQSNEAFKKIVTEMYSKIVSGKANPGQLHTFEQSVADSIFRGKADNTLGLAAQQTENLRKVFVNFLTNMEGKLGDANRKFYEIQRGTEKLTQLIGRSSEKASDIANRLGGRASGQTSQTFQELEKLAEKYGIKEGQDLIKRGLAATTIDDIAGVAPRQGFAGQGARGIEAAQAAITGGKSKATDIINTGLGTFLESVFPFLKTLPKADALEALLKSSPQDKAQFFQGLKGALLKGASNTAAASATIPFQERENFTEQDKLQQAIERFQERQSGGFTEPAPGQTEEGRLNDAMDRYKKRNGLQSSTGESPGQNVAQAGSGFSFIPKASAAESTGAPSYGDEIPGYGKVSVEGGASNQWAYGLDVMNAPNTPIPARGSKGGVVKYVGSLGGFGNVVQVEMPDGTWHQYAHLNSSDLQVGQSLTGSETIGKMGNSGNVLKVNGQKPSAEELAAGRGTHLDFTVYDGGSAGKSPQPKNSKPTSAALSILKGQNTPSGPLGSDIAKLLNPLSSLVPKASAKDSATTSTPVAPAAKKLSLEDQLNALNKKKSSGPQNIAAATSSAVKPLAPAPIIDGFKPNIGEVSLADYLKRTKAAKVASNIKDAFKPIFR